jgi:hypothetical protein
MSLLNLTSLRIDMSTLLMESLRTSVVRVGNVRRWLTGVAFVDVSFRIDVNTEVSNHLAVVFWSIAMAPPL